MPKSESFNNEVPYDNKGEWLSYFTKLKDLYMLGRKLEQYYKKVRNLINSSIATLSDNEEYLKMVLGGIDFSKEPRIERNSSSFYYRHIFGMSIKEKDLKKLKALMQSGKSLNDIFEVKISDNFFELIEHSYYREKSLNYIWYSALKEFNNEMMLAFQKIEANNIIEGSNADINDVGDTRAENPINAFFEFLNKAGSLLPSSNPLSFFIYSLNYVPWFYAIQEYPKLKDTKTISLLNEDLNLGIGEKALIGTSSNDNPDEDYSIRSFDEVSAGKYINKALDIMDFLYSAVKYSFEDFLKEKLLSENSYLPSSYMSLYCYYLKENNFDKVSLENLEAILKQTDYYKEKLFKEIKESRSLLIHYNNGDLIEFSFYDENYVIPYKVFIMAFSPALFSRLLELLKIDNADFRIKLNCNNGYRKVDL
ncbi:MAG: hypothetical protein G5Z42_00015 [Caldisphaeraceae archaeon]|nr:hypothetical protein [Caldisphaeraceae archaeon]MEB3797189.1 hypothetical protein [Caldisphaeraceae archaeon]